MFYQQGFQAQIGFVLIAYLCLKGFLFLLYVFCEGERIHWGFWIFDEGGYAILYGILIFAFLMLVFLLLVDGVIGKGIFIEVHFLLLFYPIIACGWGFLGRLWFCWGIHQELLLQSLILEWVIVS